MFHVLLDLSQCHVAFLENEELLRQLLDEYPTLLTMDNVGPTLLWSLKTSHPLDDGCSGLVSNKERRTHPLVMMEEQ
jgi:hypothetical protein